MNGEVDLVLEVWMGGSSIVGIVGLSDLLLPLSVRQVGPGDLPARMLLWFV